ncbi:MAG TPA: hypothetical protein VGG91_13625 [Myxococcaceae bacterium]|jgi:hypothetical protein
MGRKHLLAALFLVSCAGGPRPFRDKDVLWTDDDERPFSPRPEYYGSPLAWTGAEETLFRPVSDALTLKRGGESKNVNALDEVPDSSWFQNRLSRRQLSTEELVRGSCNAPPPETELPWTVIGAKLEGQTPGFRIRTAKGRVYFLEFDFPRQPELASIAGVFGSRVYFAAGFNAVCDRVAFFREEDMVVPPTEKQGGKKQISPEQVHDILAHAPPPQDGRFRVKASLLAEGEPLGNWSWAGVTDDDANDIIPHEDRRELRATRLLTAWLNHYDTGDNQTLSMWIPTGNGRGWVRHHMIDWNDSLGFLWPSELDQISRRLGYAYYFDVGIIGREFINLGLKQEPWDRAHLGPTGETLGYFDDTDFVPEEWKSGYPNPAFSRMTERDAAWMARILARFTDERIDALLGEARADTPLVRSELLRILKSRRDKILRRWLVRLSSFTDPVVEMRGGARWLCLQDRAEEAGLGAPPDPWATAWSNTRQAVRTPLERTPEGVCARVPAESPDYVVIDVYSGRQGQGPARVHLRPNGVVGLERPEEQSLPPDLPREASR